MYIPHTSIGAPDHGYDILGFAPDSPPGGWSSIIGIVTAIIGNILISFALNTQRYAHMRLSQEAESSEGNKKRKDRRRRRRSNGEARGYGTVQEDIAEERAQENASAGPANGRLEVDESEPLIPRVDGKRKSSHTSEASLPGKEEEEEEKHKSKNYLKSPIWWLGIALMTVGEAGNFLAYGFAPASIVSPLGVVALVSNCLIAPLMLHEPFRWRDGVGVIIAVAGCVTVVLSASGSNPKLDPDTIWDLITTWEFETYLGITIFLIIVLSFASNKFGERTILIDIGLVGLFGGYTALSTKGVASLLSNTIWRVVTFPITYLLVAVLVSTAVLQIKYVNRALQRFNATMVIPTQFVMFTLSVIIGSAILYRDFERRSAADAAKFVGGCALTFLGVWCITSGRGDEHEGDEEAGDADDAVDLVDQEGVQPEIRERSPSQRRSSLATGARSSKTAPAGLHRTHTAESVPPSLVITPEFGPTTPLTSADTTRRLSIEPYSLTPGPANRSAIHASSPADMQPTTPQQKPTSQTPPPMHATTSAPVVPTLEPSNTLRPVTPKLNRNTSGPATPEAPRTPPNPTNTSPQRTLLSRPSLVGSLLPDLGPLTSPLSSSLSAVVADSLRRGMGDPRRSLRVRRPSKLGTLQAQKRHSIASGDMDWEEAGEGTSDLRRASEQQVGAEGNRARSLSATLADLFASRRAAERSGQSRDGGG